MFPDFLSERFDWDHVHRTSQSRLKEIRQAHQIKKIRGCVKTHQDVQITAQRVITANFRTEYTPEPGMVAA
jgi:hypothetical protein